jgi:hypothetical protein
MFFQFVIRGRYSNGGTYTITVTDGASATFRFNGTGVWIYGGKRSNHGPYNVTLDGNTLTGDGHSATDQFQVPLFSAINLDFGMHEVIIANAPDAASDQVYLDVDFVSLLR